MEEEGLKRLEDSPILEDRQGRVLGGVSEPAVRGRVVKLLAKSAPDLNATFESIWAAARALLWGLPFPALRRQNLPNTKPHHDHSNDEPTEDTCGDQCFQRHTYSSYS